MCFWTIHIITDFLTNIKRKLGYLKEGARRGLEEKIVELANELFEDIQRVRESGVEEKDRVGMEVMALNALCNAYKTMNGMG